MVKAVVTGGAGFLGSALVDRLLAEGHEVEVVDDLSTGSLANLADARQSASGRLKIHQIDISDETVIDLLARHRPEIVFHLAAGTDAAASLATPTSDARVNVIGSVNVLEGARSAGARKIVHVVAAAAIYGEPDELPVREDHPQRPLTPSGVARQAVGEYLRIYRSTHGLEFTQLVVGSIYGPRQVPGRPGSVVATVAHALLDGQPAPVEGNGRQTRDFVFVDDVVDALIRSVDRADGLRCHVGTGTGTTVNDLVRTVAGVLQVKPLVVAEAASLADVEHMVLDIGRSLIHLGWRAWTPLPEGVVEVVRSLSA